MVSNHHWPGMETHGVSSRDHDVVSQRESVGSGVGKSGMGTCVIESVKGERMATSVCLNSIFKLKQKSNAGVLTFHVGLADR